MGVKTSIRRIGNSKGVILPSAILGEVGAKEELLLSVEGGRIVLEPVVEPRKGWFDRSRLATATPDERLWEEADLSDDSDWKWE